MKLIGSLTSPYVRKVRVVLAEKKIDYEFELDSPVSPETIVPDFNPLGKIPVLILDEMPQELCAPANVDPNRALHNTRGGLRCSLHGNLNRIG